MIAIGVTPRCIQPRNSGLATARMGFVGSGGGAGEAWGSAVAVMSVLEGVTALSLRLTLDLRM